MATNLTGQDMSGWLWQQSDPNTQFNTYNPATGQWSAGSAAGWTRDRRSDNEFVGITNQIGDYLRAMGFGGDFRQTGTDSLMAQFGGGREELSRRAEEGITEESTRIGRNPELDAWLQSQGLTLQQGVHHIPGYSQKTWIQRLTDAQGNPVAVDAHNDRYGAADSFMNAVQVALLVAGGAAAGQAAGAWNLGGGAAGAAGAAPTLGAGATGAGSAGLTASLPSSAELLGGLTSSSSLFNPIAMAPSLGAGAGLTAGIGAADMGGLSSAGLEASGWAAPISGAQSSAGLGSFGTLGAGAGAPSVTTPGISAADTAGIGLSNTAPLTGVPSTVGGGGLLGSIANSGVGQAVGQVADLVGGGRNLAVIAGGLLGATQGGKSQTATTQSRTDPRFDPYLYGDNGFLSQLQQQFNATKSGTNADITAGQNMLRDLYTSPAYTQGYQDMRSAGQGLLGRSIAGNPFTMASPPQFGRNSPAMQQSPENPFMGMFAQTQTMPQRGLLNPFGG